LQNKSEVSKHTYKGKGNKQQQKQLLKKNKQKNQKQINRNQKT